jgi:hypothetical protein
MVSMSLADAAEKPSIVPSFTRLIWVGTAIVGLIFVATIRSAVATRTDGFTIDEAYHITAGVSYAKLWDFRLNPEHPPLVKLWTGLWLTRNFKLPPLKRLADKPAERDFTESAVFFENDPDRIQMSARVAMWVFNGILLLLLALAVFRSLGSIVALGTTYRNRGPFLYFPAVLAAKLPVGLLALALAGLSWFLIGKVPQPAQLPCLALCLVALFFLVTLVRGVSYGGSRHALPVLVVLSVFGGVSVGLATWRPSRLGIAAVALALIGAMASAFPRIRPWEYFNEFVGGPKAAYLHFADEGVDMGQRCLDLVRYYREHLLPAGEIPYVFYPMSASEQKRREVRTRNEDDDQQSADVSGIFFVNATSIFTSRRGLQVFSSAKPTERIGNLLIYRGTFHIPALAEQCLLRRADRRLRNSPTPDLDLYEADLRQVLDLKAKNFGALLRLGTLWCAAAGDKMHWFLRTLPQFDR